MMVRTVLVDPTRAVQEAHLEQIADGTGADLLHRHQPVLFTLHRLAPSSHIPRTRPRPTPNKATRV